MITLSEFTELLGWTSLLNIGFLISAAILLVTFQSSIASLHSKIFALPESELLSIYFKYLAAYKVLVFIFIIAPYIALKIMGL